MDVRNDGVDVGNDYICIYRKFGLEVNSQRWPCGGDGTYVENVENPVEVQSPGGDRLFIILRVEDSRDRILFTPFDVAPLDLGHSTAIERSINE